MHMQSRKGNDMEKIEKRVLDYWTVRAHDFGVVRRNEIHNKLSKRWSDELDRLLPEGKLRILDVGTGTGYFAVLLAAKGHAVTGIDLTPAMIGEAKALADELDISARFEVMDAQSLDFPDESFDAVVTRNLTWTLPEPERAYSEWLRVLAPGGILINFDASYGNNVRNNEHNGTHLPVGNVYGHCGMTPELESENAQITLSMPISKKPRPEWDAELLISLGCADCGFDKSAGTRILAENDLSDAPMFLVWAKK